MQVGQIASPLTNNMTVESIKLQITSGAGTKFNGVWLVHFDPSTTIRPLKPIAISTTLTVDTTVPTAATITGCQGQAPGPSLDYSTTIATEYFFPRAATDTIHDCPPGYVMTGVVVIGMSLSNDAAIDHIRCTKLK